MTNKWGEPYDCPVLLLEEFSMLCFLEEEPNQSTSSPWVKSPRKTKWIEFAAENNCKERPAIEKEKPRDLQRIHLKYSVEYWSTHAHEENTQVKKERIKWKVHGTSKVQGTLPVPNRVESFIIYEASFSVLTKV